MPDGRSGGQCGPPIGNHSIKVFGMDHTRPPPTHILFSREPRVVQPTLAHEIDRPVRQCGPHIGGDPLNASPKLSLASSDFLFCPLCLSNIEYPPREIQAIQS